MNRSAVAVVLAAALLVSGCATQQPLLPPGEDPNRLAAAIARRGQCDSPVPTEPPGSGTVADYMTTTVKVAASAGVIALVLGYVVAAGLSHSSGSLSFDPQLGQVWNDIWSAN